MEQLKEKKTRECGFINILDPKTKELLSQLVSAPEDSTNFIFWFSKVNNADWGLTIKSIPNKDDKEGFPSQHTWKITWVFKDGMLKIANHCKSLGKDVDGDNYQEIVKIYTSYRKK
jgi:hypothetical protein